MIQLEAVLVAVLVMALVAALQRVVAAQARRRASLAIAPASGSARVLYFSGPDCTICRTHQEPALSQLAGVSIEKIDAVAERSLADRYRVFTVPTTVVVSAAGETLNVNYGYTSARKLREQLALA